MPTKHNTIDEYIASFPKDIQKTLQSVKQVIQQACPKATETINYAIPTFKLNEKFLVYFAAFKSHIGFYATPTGHAEFEKNLSAYKQGMRATPFTCA